MSLSEIFSYSQKVFFGNTIEMYAVSFGLLSMTLFIGGIFRWILAQRLKQWAMKTATDFDDTLVSITERVSWQFLVVTGVFIGAKFLVLPEFLSTIIWAVFLATLVFYGVRAIQDLIEFFFHRQLNTESGFQSRSALKGLLTVVKYSLWVLGFLLIASNLGMNITSLIAGLGVGGVAVAFALQNILEDLFSSFALYFDRPFQVGDYIVVGQQSGTVERIGIKTTRLKALQGEQIVISNRELTTLQIQNFKKLEERRVVIRFGVTYETSQKQRESIPQIVENVVQALEGVRFERTHLDKLADSALVYETVYYVEDPSFDIHMDRKQEFLFSLMNVFASKKIELAYPTQKIWLKNE